MWILFTNHTYAWGLNRIFMRYVKNANKQLMTHAYISTKKINKLIKINEHYTEYGK